MNISMILNATFRGKTEENSVKNHDEEYMAVWKPWNIDKEIYYLIIRIKRNSYNLYSRKDFCMFNV
jgi:hypothetical protein